MLLSHLSILKETVQQRSQFETDNTTVANVRTASESLY